MIKNQIIRSINLKMDISNFTKIKFENVDFKNQENSLKFFSSFINNSSLFSNLKEEEIKLTFATRREEFTRSFRLLKNIYELAIDSPLVRLSSKNDSFNVIITPMFIFANFSYKENQNNENEFIKVYKEIERILAFLQDINSQIEFPIEFEISYYYEKKLFENFIQKNVTISNQNLVKLTPSISSIQIDFKDKFYDKISLNLNQLTRERIIDLDADKSSVGKISDLNVSLEYKYKEKDFLISKIIKENTDYINVQLVNLGVFEK